MKWMFTLTLVMVALLAQSYTPQNTNLPVAVKAAVKRGQDKRSDSSVPVDPIVSEAPRITINSAQSAPNPPPNPWWKDPITVFTGMLVLVGGFQAFVYWHQKNIMRESLEVTKTATEATKKAADAADKNASVAIAVQLPRLMLFHLDFEKVGVSNWDGKLQSPVVNVIVKNYGATTAFLKSRGLEIFWGIRLPSEPDYSAHAYDVEPETVIDPQGTYTLTNKDYRPMISPQDVNAIKEQHAFLWVYGYVQYIDFLGGRHMVRFCKQLVPSVIKIGSYSFIESVANPEYLASG